MRDRNYGIGFFADRIAGVRPNGRTGCLPYGNPYGVGILGETQYDCEDRVTGVRPDGRTPAYHTETPTGFSAAIRGV